MKITALLPLLLLSLPAEAAWTPPAFDLSEVDAGLSEPFQYAAAPSGVVRSILDYGATPGDASDDDAVAIREAIRLASAGDIVSIPEGVFHVKSSITLKSGVHLIGEGIEQTLLEVQVAGSSDANYMLYVPSNSQDVSIRHLELKRTAGVEIDDMIEVGTSSGNNARRVHLGQLKISGFQQRGINVRNANHVLVEDVHVSGATNVGGGGNGYGIILNNPGNNNNWIRNCVIEGPMIRHAILIQYQAHHNLVEYCTISNTTEDSIDLHGEDEYSNELRYNVVSGSARAAFGVGNTGGGPPPHDDSGPYNWIHDNIAWNCQRAVRFDTSATPTAHTVVERNYFFGNQFGIWEKPETYAGMSHTIVRNNILTGHSSQAILLTMGEGNSIRDNILTGNGQAIQVRAPVTGFEVVNNDLRFHTNIASRVFDGAEGTWEDNLEAAEDGEDYFLVFAGDDQVLSEDVPFVTLQYFTVVDGVPFPDDSEASWSVLSGTGNVIFQEDEVPARSLAIFSKPGVYVLQLTVAQDDRSASDTVTITIEGTSVPFEGWVATYTGWTEWTFSPWVYHQEHGWIFVFGDNDGTFEERYVYYPEGDLGWIYLHPDTFPSFYSFERQAGDQLGTWLLSPRNSIYPDTRWFYDYGNALWYAVAPTVD